MKWTFLITLLFCISVVHSQKEKHQWEPEDTEVWTPVPPVVQPGIAGKPPSDAIVLFQRNSLDAWCAPTHPGEDGEKKGIISNLRTASRRNDRGPALWHIVDSEIEVIPGKGAIETKESFGSIQLHIEWLSPVDEGKTGQGYSNSGIFFMGLYELQVLNAYKNETYSNGMAGSIYKQHIPLANAAFPPGEWQTYDVVFNAPEFGTDGMLIKPAFMTVFWNGVLVQNHVKLKGPTLYIGQPGYFGHAAKLPLRLQDHGDRVRYRNIWVREL